MKILAMTLLAASLSSAVMADPFYATTNATKTAFNTTVGVTVFPSFYAIVCMVENSSRVQSCADQMSTTYGVAVTSTSTVLLKEEIKNVEVDAYDFLANGDKTLALEEMIAKIRENAEELDDNTDEEIVTAMLKLI